MFEKVFSFGSYQVEFLMKESPGLYSGDHTVCVWGYPYNSEDKLLISEWNDDTLNQITGYYFAYKIKENELQIINDFLGGYRVYYVTANRKLLFTDDLESAVRWMKDHGVNACEDSLSYSYWKKHRYTLDERTLFHGLNKVSPNSIIKISSDGIRQSCYYRSFPRKTDTRKFLNENYENIKTQLKELFSKNAERTFLLFYSGGCDSTLLLFLCRELNIPVKCVIIHYVPDWSVNMADSERAIANLRQLKIPYDVVDVDLQEAVEKYADIATERLLFNRHMAVHFFKTYEEVVKKYGRDIIILNGQSADSVLSFGPSEFTLGNMLKRGILAVSDTIIGRMLNLIGKFLHRQYLVPKSKTEAYEAMLDDTNYKFLVDTKCTYPELIRQEIEKTLSYGFKDYESIRMYLKIVSFLQGSDNQVVIEAAREFGISRIVMPFTDPQFIYNIVRYKNNLYEVIRPKYFVRDTLRNRFHYEPLRGRSPQKLPSDYDMEATEAEINSQFEKKRLKVTKFLSD